jgi:hypothetical protein
MTMAKKAPTSDKIAVTNARGAFVKLETAEYFNPAKPGPNEVKKYRMNLLLDPSNAVHAGIIKQMKSEALRISREEWGNEIPKSLEFCYGLGNDLDKIYDGFKDMFYIKVSSESRVPTVGRRKNSENKFTPTQAGDAEFPYSGAFVNAKITLWVQTTHGRKGINANLLTVQFVKDGPGFGRPSADPDVEFDALEDSTEGASDDTSMFE